jgi:hypothetical protein
VTNSDKCLLVGEEEEEDGDKLAADEGGAAASVLNVFFTVLNTRRKEGDVAWFMSVIVNQCLLD